MEINKETNLTDEVIKELKKEHKKLFKTTMADGMVVVWHPLNRKEYKELMKAYEDVADRDERVWLREEEACRLAVVYPDKETVAELVQNSAGWATLLSDEIYEKSGFKLLDNETEQL